MIKKIISAFRLYKFGIFRIYLNKLFPDFFQFQTFLIYAFDLNDPNEQKDHSLVEFHRIEHPKGELFKLFQQAFPAKVFEDRLSEANQVLYLALKGDEVYGYGWLASDHLEIETINYDYIMNKAESFVHACYVPKHARGMGIYSCMLKKMLADSKMNGKEKVYIGVSSANAGSIRGIEKSGFKFQSRIHYVKIGRNEWWKGIPTPTMVPSTPILS